MPETLNEQVVDGITAANAKNLMEIPTLSAGVSIQNQVAQQQRMNDMAIAVTANTMNAAQQIAQNTGVLAQAMMGRVARMVLDTSAEQAVAFAQQIGADLAGEMKDMGGTLAGIEQFTKIAASTPPQTGTGGAFGSDSGSALLQQLANIQALLQSLAEKIK